MIVVLGSLSEPMVASVFDVLRSRGRLVAHVSPSDLPASVRLEVHLERREAWLLRPDGLRLALHEASAVYHRLGFVDFQQGAHASDEESRFTNTECLAALNPTLSMLSALVVNRPVTLSTLACRPFRLAAIQQSGLLTPESVVTNDAEQAIAFYERHDGEVVCKSVSYLRPGSHTAQKDQLSALHWPVHLQQRISGVDLRVHVVGDMVLASKVTAVQDSSAEPCTLDSDLQKRCVALARRLGLSLAALDVRISDDGVPYCLDVDPCPEFTRYESPGPQSITMALCDILEAADVR